MFNNPVQLVSNSSLDALTASYQTIPHAPVAIASAIAAVSKIGTFFRHGSGSELTLLEPNIQRFGSVTYHPNHRLCEQLNDIEWQSLPLKDNFTLFKSLIFSSMPCNAVVQKLNSELLKDIGKIISNMEYPGVLFVQVGASTGIIGNNLFITSNDIEQWWNLETSEQRKQMQGLLAHEVAHKILKHSEKATRKTFEILGITVKSLDDVESVLLLLNAPISEPEKQEQLSRLSESAKALYADVSLLIERDPFAYQKTEIDWAVKDLPFFINKEIEADLLTLRVPEYARGLRDFLTLLSAKCEGSDSVPAECNDPQHPSPKHRMTYLTDALCEKYPSQNEDICQCTTTDKQI